MTEPKKEATKPTKKRPKIATKPKVRMIEYSVTMVIPTAQYANVQPRIVVKADSFKEAHDFIAPHMNKLWKEYYLVNERRPEPTPPAPAPAPVVTPAPAPVITPVVEAKPVTTFVPDPNSTSNSAEDVAEIFDGKVIGTVPGVQPPDSSVALVKATQALESCLTLDAFDIINNQVMKSVKLTEEDKKTLMPLLEDKLEKLSNGT